MIDVKCPECDGTGGVAGAPDFDGDKEAVTNHTCLVCMGKKKIYFDEVVLVAINQFKITKGSAKKKASFIQALFTKLGRVATGRELHALRGRDATRRLVYALDAYIEILGEECGALTVMMGSRGYKSTRIEEGKKARDEMKKLRAEAGLDPLPEKGKKR